MTQPQLDIDFAVGGDPGWLVYPQSVIEWAFKRFHDANPDVYRRLERAALAWAASNPNRVGVKRLAEDLRYAPGAIDTAADPQFRINNNHTALYARLLIHRHPQLERVIELRVRKEPDASV